MSDENHPINIIHFKASHGNYGGIAANGPTTSKIVPLERTRAAKSHQHDICYLNAGTAQAATGQRRYQKWGRNWLRRRDAAMECWGMVVVVVVGCGWCDRCLERVDIQGVATSF